MSQPQTSTSNPQAIQAVNAKWVNGVAPGFWPTAGSGLTLNLSDGTSFAGSARYGYTGGTLSLTDNSTNYVFLDTTASNVPAFNTSGYPATGIPIATVVTASGAITAITDDRGPFRYIPPGTGSVTSVAMTGDGTVFDSTVSGSPVTTSGTLAPALLTQAANTVLAGPTAVGPTAPTFRSLIMADLPAQTGSVGITIDGVGSVPATGLRGMIQYPYGATITGWAIIADQPGTASVDIWFIAGSAPPAAPNIPTSSNKISASAPVTLAAQSAAGGASAISTWSPTLTQWGTVGFNLVSVTTCTRLTIEIYLTRT